MEKRTSAPARIFAVLALIGAVLIVVVVLSSTSSDDNGGGEPRSNQTAKQQQQQDRPQSKAKTYVVQSGDTLTAIAHRTGVPVQEILALNPEVDPQILIAGETLKLR
ncbi:MAG TPA: LysM domain-containing protein [Solirubrobacterales bacterium]|nr:LysM domain-containing protein [Solirubrobacterales bacterium]